MVKPSTSGRIPATTRPTSKAESILRFDFNQDPVEMSENVIEHMDNQEHYGIETPKSVPADGMSTLAEATR
jgi:hypothetical protein